MGGSGRISTHATADAIDVSGFDPGTGQIADLRQSWPDQTEIGAFLRAAHESACKWFVTALGPDYNALHTDRFHLQNTGWGTCR